MTEETAKPAASKAKWHLLVAAVIVTAAVIGGLALDYPWLNVVYFVAATILSYAFFAAFYYVLVAGMLKIRHQRKVEFEQLPDDNTVEDHPDGERKLHEYLTAITSTEARIGLIQTSQPWPGDKDGNRDDT